MDKVFKFGIKKTNCGATAWMITPSGRKQSKHFRNSYASGESKAETWIKENIQVIKESETIENLKPSTIIYKHEIT